MTFQSAVESTAPVRDHFRAGLQGLRKADRGRLRYTSPRRLRGSVNVDQALRGSYPNDPRWDYAIGIRRDGRSDEAVWAEVHAASSLHVNELLAKLQWLRRWLVRSAPQLGALRGHFCWIATGSVSFRRGSQEEKKISQAGLRFPVRQLDIDLL